MKGHGARVKTGAEFRVQGDQGEKIELLKPARKKEVNEGEECEMSFSRSWV